MFKCFDAIYDIVFGLKNTFIICKSTIYNEYFYCYQVY